MKISCPSCSAKYSIADEKVQNRLAKIRCRKCGTSIVIDGNVSPANVYAADAETPAAAPQGAAASQGTAAPAAASGTSFSVDLGETDQRQMSVAEIVDAYNSGTITAETFVWADGFPDWTALGQVDEIVAALHAAASSDALTAPTDETSALGASTVPDENPWEASGPSIPQVPAAPAAPMAPTGGGADLFGNVARAGSEFDQQPSASPFGGAQPAPQAADSGARNESSVLFSLSALTSGASNSRPSMPAPAGSGAKGDDSGLIDLRALTAAAETAAAAPAAPRPVTSPLGLPSPLGGPLGASPLGMGGLGMGGMGVGASIPPQTQKSNTGLFIGGGIVIAAIAVASIITFGGNSDQPVAPPAPVAPVAAPAQVAAPEPIPTAAALPTSDAKPPSTGTEADEPAPTKGPASGAKPRPKSQPSTKSPSPGPSPSASPSPAPKAKPATGKCGCKTDDLMCLMNCAQ